jgi:hypothetical protein
MWLDCRSQTGRQELRLVRHANAQLIEAALFQVESQRAAQQKTAELQDGIKSCGYGAGGLLKLIHSAYNNAPGE